jgi:hypothetical protein
MKAIDEIRTLIFESRSRDRFIDATEIAQVAQLHYPAYSVGELVSLVVKEAVTLPQMR